MDLYERTLMMTPWTNKDISNSSSSSSSSRRQIASLESTVDEQNIFLIGFLTIGVIVFLLYLPLVLYVQRRKSYKKTQKRKMIKSIFMYLDPIVTVEDFNDSGVDIRRSACGGFHIVYDDPEFIVSSQMKSDNGPSKNYQAPKVDTGGSRGNASKNMIIEVGNEQQEKTSVVLPMDIHSADASHDKFYTGSDISSYSDSDSSEWEGREHIVDTGKSLTGSLLTDKKGRQNRRRRKQKPSSANKKPEPLSINV